MKAALLACTAILSGVCMIPLWTGFFAVPVEYPWPRVVIRSPRRPIGPGVPLNGTAVFYEEELAG